MFMYCNPRNQECLCVVIGRSTMTHSDPYIWFVIDRRILCYTVRGFLTHRPSPDRGPEVTRVRDWVAERRTGTYKILNANAYVFHFFFFLIIEIFHTNWTL